MSGAGVKIEQIKRECHCPKARHVHGTRRAYVRDQCRCVPCITVYRRWQKETRFRVARVGVRSSVVWRHPAGTSRRLQALAVVGWSNRQLAAQLSTSNVCVNRWQNADCDRVYAPVHKRVAALYDEIWDKEPPGQKRLRVQRHAAKKGWVAPLYWDDETIDDPAAKPYRVRGERGPNKPDLDEVAIQRAMAGDTITLTKAERLEATRLLTERDHSAADIADRIGVTQRTSQRDRAEVAA
jgi:hypothetical protein